MPTSSDFVDTRYQFAWMLSLMRLLSGPSRLEYLIYLSEGPADVSALTEKLKLHISLVSSNLHKLAKMQLVTCERDKQRVIYRLQPGVQIVQDSRGMKLVVAGSMGSRMEIRIPRCQSGVAES